MDVRRARAHTGITRVIDGWRREAERDGRAVAFLDTDELGDASPRPWEPAAIARSARRHEATLFHALYPLVALTPRVPSLLTLYDTLQLDRGPLRGRAAGAVLRRNVRLSGGVLTISEYSRGAISRRLGVDPALITVAHPGIELPPTAEPSPGRYLLYIGNAKEHKHVEQLVRWAPSVLAAHELSLVAVVPREAAEGLSPASNDEHVYLRHGVDDGELARLQAGAVAYVSLADGEGFGLPPLECAARGVPSVLLDGGAHREVMGDGATYCTLDRDDLATAVSTLVHDRARYAERALARAEVFSWSRSWSQVRAAYDRLAT